MSILVFGSSNMDLVFSIEKTPVPGQTILCSAYETTPGGKGANQAIAAKRSLKNKSCLVQFIGCVGNDVFGSVLKGHLDQENVDVSHLKEASSPTGCASIWVDKSGENTIVVATGANRLVKATDVEETNLSTDTILLLQMETPAKENWDLIDRAHQKGTSIFLNLAPAVAIPVPILKKVSYLIINEHEALDLLDILHLPKDTDYIKNSAILSRFTGQTCIITRGAKGYIASNPEYVWQGETLKITPVDTTGAGDTFIGALSAALKDRMPFEEALRFGAIASSLACLKKGAQVSMPTYSETETYLSSVPLPQKKAFS